MNEKSSLSKQEYVDFNQLKQYIGISNPDLFVTYLKEVFKDLADRSESEKRRGITKMTFFDYLKLSVFISEKMFAAFDNDCDSYLSPKEFVGGMKKLYIGSFEETVQIIFDLLDFNRDGLIEKEDVRILLSYLPLKNDTNAIEYKYQMKSLDDIEEIICGTFESETSLNLPQFTSVIENKRSDVYFQILCFLYQQKPFTEENIQVLKLKDFKKKRSLDPSQLHHMNDTYNILASPDNGKYLPSPNLKCTLSPASKFLVPSLRPGFELNPVKRKLIINDIDIENEEDEDDSDGEFEIKEMTNTPQSSGTNGMIRFHNEKIPTKTNENVVENKDKNIHDIIKNSRSVYISPSNFLSHKKPDKTIKPFSLNSNSLATSSSVTNNTIQEQEEKEEPQIAYEAYMYKIIENNKLKKYFLSLSGKDIFYYKTHMKEEMFGMHNLSGCFVKDSGTQVLNDKTYYSFEIVFPSRSRIFYCLTKEICDNFIKYLKQSFGYLNFSDFYEMKEELGKGIFGSVKLGEHKKTKKKVAIKIIKKTATSQKDLQFFKTEIDILKLCHHPNIVKLLDHFENADYIFIVMEHISGGDLKSYMKKKDYCISESFAASVTYQIADGIKYLHQFGIIHRDLKPENIMLTEPNENGKVKIMDFGLSKILGHNEKSIEGFGTLCFVAPEVLKRIPYNREIDIWSLGVILYVLLSGSLPFDDENDIEESIAKLIVYSEVSFPENIWKNRHASVIDLIKQCLIKDPSQRIKINDVLSHEWFKLYPH